jgi:hypothetical protein
VLFYLAEQLDGVRLVAGLGRIGVGNHGFDLDGHYVAVGSNQSSPTNSFAWQVHYLLVEKVYRDQLRNVHQMWATND